jgi:hypothetical protein
LAFEGPGCCKIVPPPTRVCDPFRSKNTALGVFRTPGGGVGDLFCPLVYVDWGTFCQMVTRATGHLGFGVFIARQRPWHGGPPLPCRVMGLRGSKAPLVCQIRCLCCPGAWGGRVPRQKAAQPRHPPVGHFKHRTQKGTSSVPLQGLGCPKLQKCGLPIGRGGCENYTGNVFQKKIKKFTRGPKSGPKRAKTAL